MIIEFNNKGTPEQMCQSLLNSVQRALSSYGAVGSQVVDRLYPIGTVYFTTRQMNPSEQFGGKWADISDTGIIDEVSPTTRQIRAYERIE